MTMFWTIVAALLTVAAVLALVQHIVSYTGWRGLLVGLGSFALVAFILIGGVLLLVFSHG